MSWRVLLSRKYESPYADWQLVDYAGPGAMEKLIGEVVQTCYQPDHVYYDDQVLLDAFCRIYAEDYNVEHGGWGSTKINQKTIEGLKLTMIEGAEVEAFDPKDNRYKWPEDRR